jgi:hypothetical protein
MLEQLTAIFFTKMEEDSMKGDLEKQALWNKRIDECQASGLSIKKWCQENNIVYPTFQYWRAKILNSQTVGRQRPQITRKSFTELVERPRSNATGVEIVISKTTIRLQKGFDENVLKSCLCAIGE